MIEEVYIIDDHLFEDHINVVFSDNIRKSIKDQCKQVNIKSKPYTPCKSANAVVCCVDEKNYSATWVIFDINEISPGIIVHECVHLALNIMHSRGLKHNHKTDEAYAYMTQWLFNKITGFYEQFKITMI